MISKTKINEILLKYFDNKGNLRPQQKKKNDTINELSKKKTSDNTHKEKKSRIIEGIHFNEVTDNKRDKMAYKKLGRKRKKSSEIGIHTQKNSDNIIRKLKSRVLEEFRNFLNILLVIEDEKEKFLKINNEYFAKNIKVDFNLALLNVSLKDIFFNEISSKYQMYESDYNKKLTNSIIMNQKSETSLKNFLNLTFSEGLDIFRYKESDKIKNVFGREILNKMKKVENLVETIIKQELNKGKKANEILYYVYLVIKLLYNYENYFHPDNRKPRQGKIKNNGLKK